MEKTITSKPGKYNWKISTGIPGLDKIEIGAVKFKNYKRLFGVLDYSYAAVLPDGKTVYLGRYDIKSDI